MALIDTIKTDLAAVAVALGGALGVHRLTSAASARPRTYSPALTSTPEAIIGRLVDEAARQQQDPNNGAWSLVVAATLRVHYTTTLAVGDIVVAGGKHWAVVGSQPSGAGAVRAYRLERADATHVDPRSGGGI